MYLQLHGELPPLDYAENPYKGAMPLPVYSAGYPALGQNCAVNLPNDLLKKSAKSFKDSVKELEKTYNDIRTGKKKIKVNEGSMAAGPSTVVAVVQGGKWVVKNWEKLVKFGGALQTLFFTVSAGAINSKTMNRYNGNAFGVQNLCEMDGRQILAQIENIDAEINSVTNQLQSTSKFNVIKRSNLAIDLASLTQFRLAYQRQLDSIGGARSTGGGGLGIAAALGLALSFLR